MAKKVMQRHGRTRGYYEEFGKWVRIESIVWHFKIFLDDNRVWYLGYSVSRYFCLVTISCIFSRSLLRSRVTSFFIHFFYVFLSLLQELVTLSSLSFFTISSHFFKLSIIWTIVTWILRCFDIPLHWSLVTSLSRRFNLSLLRSLVVSIPD